VLRKGLVPGEGKELGSTGENRPLPAEQRQAVELAVRV